MKKTVCILAMIGAVSGLQAQKFYGKVNIGYGIPSAKEASPIRDFVQIRHVIPDTVSKYSETANINGLGGGMQAGGAIGYMITTHIGVELGVHYLSGKVLTAQSELRISPDAPEAPDLYATVKIDLQRYTRQVRLTPSLIVMGGTAENKIRPYGRLGILMPVGGKSVTTVKQAFDVPAQLQTNPLFSTLKDDSTITQVLHTKGKIGLGYQAAVGVNVQLGKNSSLFGEVALQSLSGQAAKTSLVKYEENGKDRLSNKVTYEKEIEYVDQLTTASNNIEYNPENFKNAQTGEYDYSAPGYQKPKQDLRIVSQFSNVGLNIGVRFGF